MHLTLFFIEVLTHLSSVDFFFFLKGTAPTLEMVEIAFTLVVVVIVGLTKHSNDGVVLITS